MIKGNLYQSVSYSKTQDQREVSKTFHTEGERFFKTLQVSCCKQGAATMLLTLGIAVNCKQLHTQQNGAASQQVPCYSASAVTIILAIQSHPSVHCTINPLKVKRVCFM